MELNKERLSSDNKFTEDAARKAAESGHVATDEYVSDRPAMHVKPKLTLRKIWPTSFPVRRRRRA